MDENPVNAAATHDDSQEIEEIDEIEEIEESVETQEFDLVSTNVIDERYRPIR